MCKLFYGASAHVHHPTVVAASCASMLATPIVTADLCCMLLPTIGTVSTHVMHISSCPGYLYLEALLCCGYYYSCRYFSCYCYWPFTRSSSIQGPSSRLWQRKLHCTSIQIHHSVKLDWEKCLIEKLKLML